MRGGNTVRKIFIILCMLVSISLAAMVAEAPMGDDEHIDIVYTDCHISAMAYKG